MARYACDWCGRSILSRRVVSFRDQIPVSLHMDCYGRWAEVMRAMGHLLPGRDRPPPREERR